MNNKPLSVLIIEDEERDAQLVARLISKAGYDLNFEQIDTEVQMRAALKKQKWDVIISDYSMPHFNGRVALTILLETGLDIPFIFISGTVGEDVAVEMMRAGANDYLMKDKMARLVPAIERELAQAEARRKARQAEADLMKGAEMHRIILKTAMSGFWLADMQGHLLEVNDSYCRMSGFSEQELLAMRITDLEVVESAADTAAHIRKVIANGNDHFETRHHRKDGSIMDVEVSAQYQAIDGGLLVVFLNDITERRKAQEALKENERKFRALAEYSVDTIMRFDRQHRHLYVNPVVEETTGIAPELFIGKTHREMGFPDDLCAVWHDAIEKVFQTGKVNRVEFMLPSGRWIDWLLAPELDDKDAVIGVVASARDTTERKNAEKSLKERDALFSRLSAKVPGMIYKFQKGVDGTFCVPFTTEAIKDLFGCLPQDVENDFSPIARVILPEDLKKVVDSIEYSAVHLAEWQCEYRVQIPGQPVKWLSGHSTPTKLNDGSIIWYGFNTDITVRKLAEAELRKKDRDLRESQRLAKIGSWHLNVLTNEVVWSDELYRMYGADPSLPPLYTDSMKLFTPESWTKLSTAIANAIETKVPYELELEALRKDGNKGWMWTRGEVEVDSGGKVIGLWGATQDITERKRQEGRDRLWRNVLECMTQSDDIRSAIGRIVDLVRQETGLDAVGVRFREGDDYPYIFQAGFSDDFLLAENQLAVRDKAGGVCRNADGSICLECTCGLVISGKTDPSNPLFTPGGSYWTNNSPALLDIPENVDPRLHPRNRCIHSGYLSVALIPLRSGKEIVGLLQLNDRNADRFSLEMINYFERLCASIGMALARTQMSAKLEEANAKLLRSMEELAETHQRVIQQERLSALGQMASGIAHDFNNVLMPILGFSELMMSQPDILDDRKEALDMLKMINSAGNDARQIVSRMRSIYKGEDTINSEVDLREVVNDSIALTMPKWRQEMSSKGVNIEMVKEFHDVPPIMGNASELRQVLTNIIFNSVHAMPGGGTIKFCIQRADAQFVSIEVTDTGIGMDQQAVLRCMEPFFTTKGVQGSGLGLAIVSGIVKRHRGTIEISSKPGAGTTVLMRFPVRFEEGTKEIESTGEHIQLESLRILVIDDEERSGNLVAMLLKGQGHQIEMAEGGQQGVDKLRQDKFDIIVTDRAMPGINGDKVAIAAQEICPGTPVIMLTGFGEIMNDAGECPPNVSMVMSKPVTAEELNRAIESVLRRPNVG